MAPRRAVSRAFTEIRRERIDWLDPGRIAFGEITLIAGRQGIGKSQYLCLLASRISTGELGGDPGHVLIVAAEDDPATTLKPRLEAVGADLSRIAIVAVRVGQTSDDEEGRDLLSLPTDLPTLEALIREHESRAVLFDPILSHLDGSVDSFKDQSVRKTLVPLAAIARRQRTAIVTTFHLNKTESVDVLQRVTGAGAFTQVPRSMFHFALDPDDPDGERGSRRLLAHSKTNIGPYMPTQAYVVEPILLPARPETAEPEVSTSRLRFVGESARTGKDLFGRADDEEQSELERAIAFLQDELVDGPRLTKEIERDARDAGISTATLKRARHQLGVKTDRMPGRGPYMISLPRAPLSLLDQADERPTGERPTIPLNQADLRPVSQLVAHVPGMSDQPLGENEAALLREADELVQNGHGRWIP